MDGAGAPPAGVRPGRVHPAVGQGAASSVPIRNFQPQKRVSALGAPRKRNVNVDK